MAGQEIVPVQGADYVPSFAVTLEVAAQRLKDFTTFVTDQMQEDEDFGTIPGTAKPTLLKPGAEKLCNIFGFAPRFEEVRFVEDWDNGFFHYSYTCSLLNKRTGQVEAECTASCNSKEDKYRWRLSERICPTCGNEAIIKGKEQYGGGWLCWKKKGGCGATFEDGDPQIESQEVGRIENPDPYSLVNTLQKMAQKRALIGAVLIATRASGIFTQDIEDMPEEAVGGESKPAKKKAKKGSAGKVHDDPMSKLWAWAKKHKAKDESVEAALEEGEGDPVKALATLKAWMNEA